jgi:hypothetical protein
MKTGPVRDAQQTRQCVYIIPCDCGRPYIGETSRPLEVRIGEHKYNLTRSLLEKCTAFQVNLAREWLPLPFRTREIPGSIWTR